MQKHSYYTEGLYNVQAQVSMQKQLMLPGARYSKRCVYLEITGSRFIPLCTYVSPKCENPTPEGSIKNLMHNLYEHRKERQRTLDIHEENLSGWQWWWWVVVGWEMLVTSLLALSISYWDLTNWHLWRKCLQEEKEHMIDVNTLLWVLEMGPIPFANMS